MKLFGLLAATLAFVMPLPALAQGESPDDTAAVMGALGGLFPVEPLTAEQQARLPAATALIDKIIPTGTMGELMSGVFDGMLGPLMALKQADNSPPLAELLGLPEYRLATLDAEAKARAAAMLDPDWQERKDRMAEAMPQALAVMMTAMEPSLKSAMSEMYAVSFDDAELRDIDAFFSTASGAAYARKSFSMASDPRYVGAIMQALPAALAGIGDMQAQLEAATADLAEERGFYDLEPAEQDKLASLLGMSRAELEAGIAEAAAATDD